MLWFQTSNLFSRQTFFIEVHRALDNRCKWRHNHVTLKRQTLKPSPTSCFIFKCIFEVRIHSLLSLRSLMLIQEGSCWRIWDFFLKAGNGWVLINKWSEIYKQVLNVIDTLENGLSKLQIIQRNQFYFSSSSNILTQAAINQFDERKNLHI